ncbi:MAG: YiiX/YebB-like N1pC/P60 family cysteine hydrolase [Bacteriovorax sp.]|jgi:hypothetical protein
MRKMYLVILVLLVSCSHFGNRSPAQSEVTPSFVLEENLRMEVEHFQELVEEALVWRSKSLEFSDRNKDKFKKESLSHAEMLMLYESAKSYLVLRDKIMDLAHRYEKVAEANTEVKYAPGEGTSITENQVRIDPTDTKGRDLLIRIKISLSAALVLYDNYMIGIYPYVKNKKTRKMLNQDIPGTRLKLDEITDSFFDLVNRNKMVRAISLFKGDLDFKEKKEMETNRHERYLEVLSLQSPFYIFMAEKNRSLESPGAFRAYFDRFFDRVRFMNESFAFIASKVFGNTMGLVAFRKGLLKYLPPEEKREISSQLKPLDILLEKTPFRLTDTFIPGYYGHVAIWIGDESDLRALNVWDHPSVKKFHAEIQAGKRIIEALRPGVQINTLDHFLDIDDLLVLRDSQLNYQQSREFVVRAFEQIGKDYDFNFDVETDSKIVCSEIVYVVFHNIDWPTKKALGRYTISPDNVVSKVFDDKGLEPILMYRSGERVNSTLVPEIRDVLRASPKR